MVSSIYNPSSEKNCFSYSSPTHVQGLFTLESFMKNFSQTSKQRIILSVPWTERAIPIKIRSNAYTNSKSKTPVLWNAIPVLGMKRKTGVVRVLVIFQQRPMFSHQWKALAETFWMIWLNIGLSWKITKILTTPVLGLHTQNRFSIPQSGVLFWHWC